MPFQTLQDLARFLLNPLLPTLVALLVLLIKKRPGKAGIAFALFSLYLVSIPLPSQLLNRRWEVADTVDRSTQYDAAVVLGGFVDYRWYVRHLVDEEKAVFDHLRCYHQLGQSSARILMAVTAIKSGLADRILLGNVTIRGISETKIVLDFLKKQGIPEEKVAVHSRVQHTLAEAKSVRKYCEENGIRKILLITSANHMRRAAALFHKQGLDPALLSVSRNRQAVGLESFIPSTDGLEESSKILYELVGYGAYLVQGKL